MYRVAVVRAFGQSKMDAFWEVSHFQMQFSVKISLYTHAVFRWYIATIILTAICLRFLTADPARASDQYHGHHTGWGLWGLAGRHRE